VARPIEQLTTVQRRAVTEQVERVGAIVEATPHLTIGQVTVSAHA
jgi:hypothetical protein